MRLQLVSTDLFESLRYSQWLLLRRLFGRIARMQSPLHAPVVVDVQLTTRLRVRIIPCSRGSTCRQRVFRNGRRHGISQYICFAQYPLYRNDMIHFRCIQLDIARSHHTVSVVSYRNVGILPAILGKLETATRCVPVVLRIESLHHFLDFLDRRQPLHLLHQRLIHPCPVMTFPNLPLDPRVQVFCRPRHMTL